MRISTTMVMKDYAKELNDKYESINKYNNQIATTLAFQRGSEDPVAYMKSIESCTDYTINQQQQQTQKEASSWMQTTESTLTSLNNIMTSVNEKANEAANGTNNDSDYATYAADFKSYRDELVSTLNTSYNGQYVFGESTADAPPFRLDSDGHLQYYNYNGLTVGGTTATYITMQDFTKTQLGALNLKNPIEIGANYNFDISTSAVDTIVSGLTSTGLAVNIVDQLSDVITQLTNNPSSPDVNAVSNLITTSSDAQSAVTTVNVAVGEKSNMLTQIAGTLTNNETNLTSSLGNTMEVDSTNAILNYNMAETVYKESMSMASTILQNSLFDFLK
jgi:Flagellin and related hook-associated proteins